MGSFIYSRTTKELQCIRAGMGLNGNILSGHKKGSNHSYHCATMGTCPEALWMSNIAELLEGYVRNQPFRQEDKNETSRNFTTNCLPW